jgi:NPCBM/NEW2 domain-containing protein
MPSTSNSGTRAAGFVFVCLLASVVAGIVLFFLYARPTRAGVILLAACALTAFLLTIAAIRVLAGYRKSQRLEREHGVPPGRLLRMFELRQWLILTLGIAFVALATGAVTSLRVIGTTPVADPSPYDPPAAGAPTVPATVPTTDPPTEEPTSEPASEPTDSTEPTDGTETADPGVTPEDDPAIKYLDSEDSLDGSFAANPVTFSAHRYPRGISFWCGSATDSRLQWNVAGYRHFTAVAGIDDKTEDAFGAISEFIFYDQDGRQLVPKPVDVSVGHPHKVTLDLTNVVNLRVTCSSRTAKTDDPRSTRSSFGDPVVTQ